MPCARSQSHSAAFVPSMRRRFDDVVARASRAPSPYLTTPASPGTSGPTIGMSARLNVRRNSASVPGGTTCTPSPVVPGFALARSTAILATSLFVPPPSEIDMPVSRFTARANAVRRVAQRLVMVDRLGAGHVEVPLVDARALDDRRELLEHGADLLVLERARLARHRHEHRVRAQFCGAGDRHRRANAVLPRFPGRRADDAAAFAWSADDEELRLAGSLRINQSRHRREKRVGVDKKNTRRCGHG